MKWYSCTEPPLSVHGLLGPYREGRFWRLPEDVIDTVSPEVSLIARRSSGGRVRFQTDSRTVTLRMRLKTLEVAPCMALCAAAGADVFLGRGMESRFVAYVAPETYENKCAETTFEKSNVMEQVTINLPRNEQLAGLEVGVEEDAQVLAPLPYTYETPVLFYGSSITEGGAAARPGTAYTSRVCRWLDTDYINLGFARAAKGEEAMARFIAGQRMSVFVFDYDYNAPSPEALAETHGPFFRIVRDFQPDLPVVMLSRPNFYKNAEDASRRREVILGTYNGALAQGDKNVYFIDGETLLAGVEPQNCTVDGIHPTDDGFMRMANRVYPLLKGLLSGQDTTAGR